MPSLTVNMVSTSLIPFKSDVRNQDTTPTKNCKTPFWTLKEFLRTFKMRSKPTTTSSYRLLKRSKLLRLSTKTFINKN